MAQCLLGSNPAASLKDAAQWLTLTNRYPQSNDWFPDESVEYIVNAWSVNTKLIRIPVVPLDETDSIDVERYAYLQGMHMSSLSTGSGSIIFTDCNYSDHFVVHVLNFEQANWTTHVMIQLYDAIDDVEQDSIAPVSSVALYTALQKKQDVFVDVTSIAVESFDDLTSKLTEIVSSTKFAVRYITDTSDSSFLEDCAYFSSIYSRNMTAVAELINHDNPGQDVRVYGKKSNNVWTWTGPYWTNPPYADGVEYMLAEHIGGKYQLFGMHLTITLNAGTNVYETIDLVDKIGNFAISEVIDFSYHVDDCLTEFNSINEFIEIFYGNDLTIHHTTTQTHTIRLKLKYIKVARHEA